MADVGRHSELLGEILETLPLWKVKGTSFRINAWKANTGAAHYQEKSRVKVTAAGQRIEIPGKERFVQFGRKGQADITGLIPPHGRRIEIEGKTGDQKPNDDQRKFLREVRDFGGIAIVAYRVSDVRAELLKEGVIE